VRRQGEQQRGVQTRGPALEEESSTQIPTLCAGAKSGVKKTRLNKANAITWAIF
jgi:hypothetical protein